MELSKEEARLIDSLRRIDSCNPLGIGGYTTGRAIRTAQSLFDGFGESARRCNDLFLQECRGAAFVDVKEVMQRAEARYRSETEPF